MYGIQRNAAFYIVLTGLLCLSFPGFARSPSVHIQLTNFERSKDSHSETRDIKVEGNSVVFIGPDRSNCERGRCSPKTWTFKLRPEQKKRLWNTIRGQGLLRDFKEENPTTGVGSFVELKVTIHIGKKKYTGLVAGRKNTLGTDTGMISVEAYTYMSSASSIAFILKQWIPQEP